jgi:rhodanese-related sulfurtransferase
MRPILIAACLVLPIPALAKTPPPDNPAIDYAGYQKLVVDLRDYRAGRRLAWEDFARAARAGGALLLDARSESAFRAGHIEGAVNLPFTDFTAESLRAVVGANPNRPIYIYCNNNFSNNRAPVVTKAAPLSLNVQTFVNLYGYGYRNVWELADRIDFEDPRFGWASS